MSEENPAREAAVPARPAGKGRRLLAMFALSTLIAVLGAVIGSAGTIFWLKGKHRGRRRRVVAETVESIRTELQLSSEQVPAVEKVVRQRYDNLTRLREETLPRFRAEFEGIRDEVGQALTPEQKKKWDGDFASILRVTRLFQKPEASQSADK